MLISVTEAGGFHGGMSASSSSTDKPIPAQSSGDLVSILLNKPPIKSKLKGQSNTHQTELDDVSLTIKSEPQDPFDIDSTEENPPYSDMNGNLELQQPSEMVSADGFSDSSDSNIFSDIDSDQSYNASTNYESSMEDDRNELAVPTKIEIKPEPSDIILPVTANSQDISSYLSNLTRLPFGLNKCPTPDCPSMFTDFSSAEKHFKTAHNNIFICPHHSDHEECDVFTSSRDLILHLVGSHLNVRSCIFCELNSTSVTAAREHMEKDHPFGCYHCAVEFDSCHLLFAHLMKEHAIGTDYLCVLCNKVLTSTEKLFRHWRRHLGLLGHRCTLCRCAFKTSASLLDHLKDTHRKTYTPLVCQSCLKFKTKNAGRYFQHYANDCRMFHCYYNCGYSTSFNSVLARHIVEKHNALDGAQCDVKGCTFVALSQPGLMQHKLMAHSATKKKRRTVASSSKNPDVKVELKNRYPCKFLDCGEEFDELHFLVTHIKTKHKRRSRDDVDGYFGMGKMWTRICDLCGRLFRDIAGLSRHRLVHDANQHNQHKCDKSCKCEWPTCYTCGVKYTKAARIVQHFNNSENCHPTKKQKYLYATYFSRPQQRKQNPPSLACPLCDHKSSHTMHFSRHLFFHWRNGDSIPAGYEFRYVECPYCDHKCCDPSKLRRHLVVHTDVSIPKTIKFEFIKCTT